MEMIFLYGPPGSGKTTLGTWLARSLALPFYDLDSEIEAGSGRAIPDIFRAEGEAGFRQRERICLQEVLKKERGVVALGGGALLDGNNRRQVESAGPILSLDADLTALASRLAQATGSRPLLGQAKGEAHLRLAELLERRASHYHSFTLLLDTTTLPVAEAAWEAQVLLGRFHVTGMGPGYDVVVREGALASLGKALQERGLHGPLALVSDENVGTLYAPQLLASLNEYGFQAHGHFISPGENHKNMASVMRLWDRFIEMGLERRSTMLAVGGGVVGDLAGFAAATYMRGVNWVVAPTSLLAMVDASLGGKTGVDLSQGKNLVGAFHAPRLVLADPATLASLPDAEVRSGLAEVVKHGLIGDEGLFNLCAQGWEAVQAHWHQIVRRAMAVKVRVVLEDPFEQGRRAELNLGHTLGHAIEAASGFSLRHGEAVAIGMVAEARLADKLGLAEPGLAGRVEQTCRGLGLPVSLPAGLDPTAIHLAFQVDKKRSGGQARFALPVKVGEVRHAIQVDDRSLLEEIWNAS